MIPVILLIEDNPADSVEIGKLFSEHRNSITVHKVSSGEEAIDYFQGLGPYTDREAFPLPSIILLDLTLPGISGFEFLTWIRDTGFAGNVTTILLTQSTSTKELKKAYALGAATFLEKPPTYDQLADIARAFSWKWLSAILSKTEA